MFRSIASLVVAVGMVFVLGSLANAQQGMPNPIAAPNPLTATLSIFRSNMQDKIMKAADAMPESKYSYRPTKDVRSFAFGAREKWVLPQFPCRSRGALGREDDWASGIR